MRTLKHHEMWIAVVLAFGAMPNARADLSGYYGQVQSLAEVMVSTASGSNTSFDMDSNPDWANPPPYPYPVSSSASITGWNMTANATAEAQFGLLDAMAILSDPSQSSGSNPGNNARASAKFSDTLLIEGGQGIGTATVTAHFKGNFTDNSSRPAMGTAAASFQVEIYGNNFVWQWPVQESKQMWQGSQVDVTPVGQFTFTYGSPFSLTGELTVSGFDGGSADFDGSAEILSIAINNQQATWEIGSVVNGQLSADPYNIHAVPEPETWAMLLAGLGVVGMRLLRHAWH
jgi:hypothetical protein